MIVKPGGNVKHVEVISGEREGFDPSLASTYSYLGEDLSV